MLCVDTLDRIRFPFRESFRVDKRQTRPKKFESAPSTLWNSVNVMHKNTVSRLCCVSNTTYCKQVQDFLTSTCLFFRSTKWRDCYTAIVCDSLGRGKEYVVLRLKTNNNNKKTQNH